MITIDVGLHCDGRGCKRTFGNAFHRHFEAISRRNISTIRLRAQANGWRRFRPKKTGPQGDYCPACQMRMAAEKGI